MSELNYRTLRLDMVRARSEQEVTVPIEVQLPANVQYLLQPVLLLPPDKQSVEISQGKVRFQAQLQGFVCGVDDDERVVLVPLPVQNVMTSFAVPKLKPTARVKVSPVVQATEVDRDESNKADILAYVKVTLQATEEQEIKVFCESDQFGVAARTETYRLQLANGLAEATKTVKEQIDLNAGVETILGTEAWVANLSWEVEDGMAEVNGQAWLRVYYVPEGEKTLNVAETQRDFAVSLDFGQADPLEAKLDCAVKSVNAVATEEGKQIDLTAVIAVNARGYTEESLAVVTGLDGADYLAGSYNVANRVGESEFRLNLEGQLQLPESADEIVAIYGRTRLLEATALEDKVLARGMLTLQIWYSCQGQKRVMVQEEEYSHFFALEGCRPQYQIEAWVWPGTVQVQEDSYSATVTLRVEVAEQAAISPVVDVHIVDETTPMSASYIVYRVARGDTLFGVAKKFNVTQQLLRQANEMAEAEQPAPGTKLIIPVYQTRYAKV